MVVVVQAGVLQLLGLAVFQHAQRHAGLQAQRLDGADHLGHGIQVMRLGTAPRGAHAESLGAARLRRARRGDYVLKRHQLVGVHAGVVVRGLRAVRAVLGTAAGLDRQQAGQLDHVRIEMGAVRLLRPVHQIHERQLVERHDGVGAPCRSGRALGHRWNGNGRSVHDRGLLRSWPDLTPLASGPGAGSADRKKGRPICAMRVISADLGVVCQGDQ